MSARVIVTASQKGGTGKTTTAVNVGIGLCDKGKKVLTIDFDPQGDLTASLGFDESSIIYTAKTVMTKIINGESFNPLDGLLHHCEGIDLLPSNIELSSLDIGLVNLENREYILKQYINMVKDFYDYIIIDCMPSLGMLTINALVCADSILIPVQSAYLPARGLQHLIRTIGVVKRKWNPSLCIEGIVITMVDTRTNFAKITARKIIKAYGEKVRVFKNTIPLSVKLAETSAEGISIYKHAPSSNASFYYRRLAEEVLANDK